MEMRDAQEADGEAFVRGWHEVHEEGFLDPDGRPTPEHVASVEGDEDPTDPVEKSYEPC